MAGTNNLPKMKFVEVGNSSDSTELPNFKFTELPSSSSSSSAPSDKTNVDVDVEGILEKQEQAKKRYAINEAYKQYVREFRDQEDTPFMMPRVAFKDYMTNLIENGMVFQGLGENETVKLTVDDLTNDVSTYGSDILSLPGRFLGAMGDEVFSLGDVMGTRSMANVRADDPLFEEEVDTVYDPEKKSWVKKETITPDYDDRNIVSGVAQSMLRDPATLPTVIGTGLVGGTLKGSQLVNTLGKVPKIGGLLKLAPLAAAETGIYEGASNLLSSDASEYDGSAYGAGTDVALNILLGGLGGGLGKWSRKLWRDELGGKKAALSDKAIDDAYEYMEGYGITEYDVPAAISDLSEDITKKGAEKSAIFKEVDKYIEGKTADDIVLSKKLIDVKGEGDEYANNIIDVFKTEAPTQLETSVDLLSGFDKAVKDIDKSVADYSMTPKVGAERKKLLSEYKDTYLNLRDEGASGTISNLNDLFNTRKSSDVDMKRIIGKLGRDKKLMDEEEIQMIGRNIINNAIDNKMNKVTELMKTAGDLEKGGQTQAAYRSIQDLHNLYNTRDALQSIGGGTGNFARTTPARFAQGVGALKQGISPASGIRQRQLSNMLLNPKGQAMLQPVIQNNPINDPLYNALFGEE